MFWADMKDKGFFGKERRCHEETPGKRLPLKCGGFFFLDPGTDMSLLELKYSVLT